MKTTKQLARELGLLRERKLSLLSRGDGTCRKKPCQKFSYLIIIDFESTCWEKDRTKAQEIIEFPAVLLNTSTGQIEDEFHYYLQPQEHPTLSAFCHKLTGISQDQVDNGIPLFLCLRKFSHWLNKLYQEKKICLAGERPANDEDKTSYLGAIVTWSDWDLGVCLHYELKRKQIPKAPCFNQWIDLRATYTKFYGRRPKGLNGALQDVGIEFEGREHSGLHDARNTGSLAWKMIRDGCIMCITKSLVSASGDHHGCQKTLAITTKNNHILRTRSPKKMSSSSTEGVTEVPDNLAFTCYKDLENNHSSVISGRHRTDSVGGLVTGLKMRNPNIPQSSQPGHTDVKCSEISQKRAAKFTPEKSWSAKYQKLSTPESTALNCCQMMSGNEHLMSASVPETTNTIQACTPLLPIPSANSASPSVRCGTQRIPTNIAPQIPSGSKLQVHSIVNPSTVTETKDRDVSLSKSSILRNASAASCATLRSTDHSSRQLISVPVLRTRSPLLQNGQVSKTSVVGATGSAFRTPPLDQALVHGSCTRELTGMKGNTPTALVSSASSRKPQTFLRTTTSTTTTRTLHRPDSSSSTTSFRTPQNHPQTMATRTLHCPNSSSSTTPFRTPQNHPQTMAVSSSMKATPPLCQCGRRAKRRMVQNPGPNIGRWFFSCVKGTAFSADSKTTGCNFFQWEHAIRTRSPGQVRPAGRQTYLVKISVMGTAHLCTPQSRVPRAMSGQGPLGAPRFGSSLLR